MIKIVYNRIILDSKGVFMANRPDEAGLGMIEKILIVILVVMILATIYFLLRPAATLYLQNILESMQQ